MSAYLNPSLQLALLGSESSQAFINAHSSQVLGVVQFGQSKKLELPAGVPRLQVAKPVLLGAPGVTEIWYSAESVQYGAARHQQSALHYAHNTSVLFGAVELPATGALAAATEQAYEAIAVYLKQSTFPYLLRVWNVLPDIHGDDHGVERYHAFNQGRYQALQSHALATEAGAPAASALGVADGHLQIYFLASTYPARTIENPRQVSAYRYPRDYGEVAPNFSRAALWPAASNANMPDDPMLFISGTASIVGHQSLHIGNATEQTHEVMRNLSEVLQQSALTARLQDLWLKVYVRAGVEVVQVVAVLTEYAIPPAHCLILQADICRTELLVEIEALLPCAARGKPDSRASFA